MKPIALASSVLATGLLAQGQLLPFLSNNPFSSKRVTPSEDRLQQHQQQHAIMGDQPGLQLPNRPPPSSNDNDNGDDKPPAPPTGPPQGDVILSDVMTSSRQISLFASFARDIDPVSKRLDSASENTTVLAPVNSAVSDLPRKPWEDPRDYAALGAQAYEGKDGEDRAHANLRRFTEAHVVPVSPWKEGEKAKTLQGGEVWWEQREGGASVIMPGKVEVEKVASRVANGEVWVLKGVLNYA